MIQLGESRRRRSGVTLSEEERSGMLNDWQVKEKRQNTQYIIHERLQRAEKLHQAQILERQRKARQEHSKVHGVKVKGRS